MSKKKQVKPLSAYKELSESGRRLVNKLIIGLHADTIDEDTRLNINRTINRAKRDPSDNGKRYTNGYLVFYKERFAQFKKRVPSGRALQMMKNRNITSKPPSRDRILNCLCFKQRL